MPKAKRAIVPEKILKKWSCTHFGDMSEIEVFVEASGQWETVAEVHSVANIDAEDIADFIVQAVIDRVKDN